MINRFKDEYRWLSNFYPCVVKMDGESYPSVEHAYQASKTLDIKKRKQFQNDNLTSGQAKKLGKTLQIRPDWEDIKLSIMEELLRQKFNQRLFKIRLIETNNKELIEGNNWGDTFWGIYNGKGSNHLGKLLMKIRGILQINRRNENYEQLKEFEKLKENWDSYGGKPISKKCLKKANEILKLFPVTEWYDIVPCGDGSVQIERHADGLDIEIWIGEELNG